MAQLLVSSQPQLTALLGALTAKGLSAQRVTFSPDNLTRVLAEHPPLIAIYAVPPDAFQGDGRIAILQRWATWPRAVVCVADVPEGELDGFLERLGITPDENTVAFSNETPWVEIADFIDKLRRLRSAMRRHASQVENLFSKSRRERIGGDQQVRVPPFLSIAKMAAADFRSQLKRAVESHEIVVSQMDKVMRLRGRDEIEEFVGGHLGTPDGRRGLLRLYLFNLEELVRDAPANLKKRVGRIASAMCARLSQALRSDRLATVYAASRGEPRALDRLAAEPAIRRATAKCAKWLRGRSVGLATKESHQTALGLMKRILSKAAAEAVENEASDADIVGITIGMTLRKSRLVMGEPEFASPSDQAATTADPAPDGQGGDEREMEEQPALRARHVLDGTEFWTLSQAAHRLGVSRQTIYNWIKGGGVVPRRIAGRSCFSSAELSRLSQFSAERGKVRRRKVGDGKFLKVRDILGFRRRENPGKFAKLRLRLIRAANAFRLSRRDHLGDRIFTPQEARRLKDAIKRDDE